MQLTQHLNTHKEVPDKVFDLNQLIHGKTGYEDYEGYKHLLHEKAAEIRDRTRTSHFKKIVNKEIDYRYEDFYRL